MDEPALAVLVAALALLAAARAEDDSAGPRCPAPPARCVPESHTQTEFYFQVEDKRIKIEFQDGQYFLLTCHENVSIASESLPQFVRRVSVASVTLRRCAPAAVSFGAALAALNVSAPARLVLERLPAAPPLAAAHLAHLPGLRALDVAAAHALAPAADFPPPLPALLELRLAGVALAPAALLRLPAGLRALRLRAAGLPALGAPALRRLERLERLHVADDALRAAPDLRAAPALLSATLVAPLAAPPPLALVENLTLWQLADARPQPWPADRCARLRRAQFAYWRPAALPPGWLRACAALRELSLDRVQPADGALPPRLAPPSLRALTARAAGLTHLAPDAFADAAELRELDLSSNRLTHLPPGVFSPLQALETLNLANNRLTPAARDQLRPLARLTDVALDYNEALGDLCQPDVGAFVSNDRSVLAGAVGLRRLSVKRTSATRLCLDYTHGLPRLQHLDLSSNNITVLLYSELQFARAVEDATVDVRDNPLAAVQYSPADYRRAVGGPDGADVTPVAAVTVTVVADAALECHCVSYWFARALAERPRHASVRGLRSRCAAPPAPLAAVPPARMGECALPEGGGGGGGEACPAACACALRLADNVTVARCRADADGEAVALALPAPAALWLEGAALRRLPVAAALRELHVARNRIDLSGDDGDYNSTSLELLDLRYNEVRRVPSVLLTRVRHLFLGGNPLACGCSDWPALRALWAASARVGDWANVTCSGGGPLPRGPCAAGLGAGAAAALAAGAALLALAALAAGAALARRRALVKRFLFARGWCLRWTARAEPAELRARPYDVFVSFSHGDERFVADELVPALERGPRPYRVCVHYRDWVPGELITAQIARSVAQARRTLVVLSDHFARSEWARAEFRAAQAAALRGRGGRGGGGADSRLIVLLRGELPAALEPELAAYVRSNTYLRWGDPWFWDKLRYALPHEPRPPPAAPPAAPLAAPLATPPAAPPAAPELPLDPRALPACA